jgi:hypothetical protein
MSLQGAAFSVIPDLSDFGFPGSLPHGVCLLAASRGQTGDVAISGRCARMTGNTQVIGRKLVDLLLRQSDLAHQLSKPWVGMQGVELEIGLQP